MAGAGGMGRCRRQVGTITEALRSGRAKAVILPSASCYCLLSVLRFGTLEERLIKLDAVSDV